MPRLVVINGPPGCGKSTLAQRYVNAYPLSLNLDIDRVRSMIGRWRDEPETAGLLARSIALAAVRTHLTAGHDVVIPQFLGRPAFLEHLERLAHETGSDFHEIVLLDSKENTLRRFPSAAGPRPIPRTWKHTRCWSAAEALRSCRQCMTDCWPWWLPGQRRGWCPSPAVR